MFGGLADACGLHEEMLDVGEDSTAADLLDTIFKRHPEAAGLSGRIRVAVNQEIADLSQALSEDDEVALLPPVAGGAQILTGLREGGILLDEAMEAVRAPDAGGVVVFVGTVRNHADEWGSVERLEYSAYREMAEPVMREVAEEAAQKWPLAGIAILHGLGDLTVGDHTVVVAASSAHRGDAFEACRYGIDEVKIRVPVWKKEKGPDKQRWVGLEEAAPPSDADGSGSQV